MMDFFFQLKYVFAPISDCKKYCAEILSTTASVHTTGLTSLCSSLSLSQKIFPNLRNGNHHKQILLTINGDTTGREILF